MNVVKFNITKEHPKKRLRLIFKRVYFKRGLQVLPNLFTLGNAFFGFCAIIFAAHGNMIAAAYFILWGALFDALDGRVARYAQATSEFGMQLDSLCDGISFCMAPAVLVYLWQLHNAGIAGFFICSFFLIAGLLRLAKFNLTNTQQQTAFAGMPSTVAGCFLTTLVLINKNPFLSSFQLILLCLVVVSLSILMISSVPFSSFKKVSKNIVVFFLGCMGVFAISFGLTILLFTTFILYFAYTFEEFFRLKLKNKFLDKKS